MVPSGGQTDMERRGRPIPPVHIVNALSRSKQRYKAASKTALSSILVRVITVLTTLISVPLAIDYLGAERYGLFITITSLIGLLGFTDLGLGNAVLTPLSRANAVGDREAAREYICSSLTLLAIVALIVGGAFAGFYGVVSWGDLFNVSSREAGMEAGPALALFMAFFLLNIPLGLVERIQLSLQEGFIYNVLLALTSTLALGGLLIAIEARAGLPWLILALSSAPAVASTLNWIVLFGFRRPWLRPTISSFRWHTARAILKSGLMFFALQAAVAIAYSSDTLIVTRVLGAQSVPEYAIPFKMFNLVSLVSAMAVAPLWPAYAESIAVGDIAWARSALKKSLGLAMSLTAPGAVVLILFGPSLLKLWVGSSIDVSTSLLVGLGAWTVMAGAGTTAAMFLNAAGILKTQVILALLMTFVNVPLSILLVDQIGVAGAIWGTVISYGAIVVLPLVLIVPKVVSRLESHPDALLAVQEADNERLQYGDRPS